MWKGWQLLSSCQTEILLLWRVPLNSECKEKNHWKPVLLHYWVPKPHLKVVMLITLPVHGRNIFLSLRSKDIPHVRWRFGAIFCISSDCTYYFIHLFNHLVNLTTPCYQGLSFVPKQIIEDMSAIYPEKKRMLKLKHCL